MLSDQQDSRCREARRISRGARSRAGCCGFPARFRRWWRCSIERQGFDGVYISGAVLANDLGLPDVGLTTLTEVARRGRAIARATDLPAIIDADTGFGEPMNVARTVQALEDAGLCGCHFEDQAESQSAAAISTASRSCPPQTWWKKSAPLSAARRDPNFLIIARTDARASEGLDGAIERAKAYVDAGADMIFPEALAGRRRVRKVPQGHRRAAAGEHDGVRQEQTADGEAARGSRLSTW